MKEYLRTTLAHSLFRNSFFLLASTGVTAIFSFVFWLLASRMFPASDVGLATTLITVITTIGMLSLLGFDNVIIRFLPHADDKNITMNSGMIVVGSAGAFLAVFFLALVDTLVPALGFLTDGILIPISFILTCIITSINILNESIFLAHRKAKYTLGINTAVTFIRIPLLFFFSASGVIGIFFAIVLSQVIGTLFGFTLLVRNFHFAPSIRHDWTVLTRVRSFSIGNYIAGIFTLLPPAIIPLMIINTLGADASAHYGIVMMIGNLLYAIPWVISRSLFAEGSHDPHMLSAHLRKSLSIIGVIMIPGMTFLYFFGNVLLDFFGTSYATEGFVLLKLVTLAGFGVCALTLIETYFRILKKPELMIIVNVCFLISIWVIGTVLIPQGLSGVGITWVASYVIAAIVGFLLLHRSLAHVHTA